MKNLIISTIIMLSFNFAQAQNFFSDGQSEKAEERGFFERESGSQEEAFPTPSNPGQDPNGAPIDDWLFLLPLLGIAVGGYYLMRNRKHEVS